MHITTNRSNHSQFCGVKTPLTLMSQCPNLIWLHSLQTNLIPESFDPLITSYDSRGSPGGYFILVSQNFKKINQKLEYLIILSSL